MSFTVLVLIVVVVLLLSGSWGYRSGSWQGPGGVLAVVLIILLILWATGGIHVSRLR